MYSADMVKTKQNTLKITQVKSRIGYKKKAKATLDAMGIKKMNQTVELPEMHPIMHHC